jgi:transposase
VVLRQDHKAGEKVFVDWAGDTIPIYDARGGPVQQAHLFVAVLGASSYTYAEVTPDEQLASWIGAHVRAFEFFQGTPKLVVPDNTKTGVTKACRYDPDSESDLPGDGHALRRRRCSSTTVQTTGQGLRFILHLVLLVQR